MNTIKNLKIRVKNLILKARNEYYIIIFPLGRGYDCFLGVINPFMKISLFEFSYGCLGGTYIVICNIQFAINDRL
ncbi:MAG: hypothetical protein FWH53_00230 [Leptospirales bacterium]|nr:hypothetical protein [Leptospirales bacterium]